MPKNSCAENAPRRPRGGKRSRNVPAAPVEHVIALDYGKTTPSAVRALGNWIGRAALHGAQSGLNGDAHAFSGVTSWNRL